MPAHGELIDEWEQGPVRVLVRHGCAARDLYELLAVAPLPPSLREVLGRDGEVRGSPALYVVEVPGRHQITVAPASGKLVVMPRQRLDRATQRADVVALVDRVAAALAG